MSAVVLMATAGAFIQTFVIDFPLHKWFLEPPVPVSTGHFVTLPPLLPNNSVITTREVIPSVQVSPKIEREDKNNDRMPPKQPRVVAQSPPRVVVPRQVQYIYICSFVFSNVCFAHVLIRFHLSWSIEKDLVLATK